MVGVGNTTDDSGQDADHDASQTNSSAAHPATASTGAARASLTQPSSPPSSDSGTSTSEDSGAAGTFANAIKAQVLPPQLPLAGLARADDYRTALVVLPESDGVNQYQVTVPESAVHPRQPYRFSVLITREWHVLFMRDPIPRTKLSAKGESGGCGTGCGS